MRAQGWKYSAVIRWRPDIASPNSFPPANDALWQSLSDSDFVTNYHKQSTTIPFDQWFIVRRSSADVVLNFVDTVVSCIKGDDLRQLCASNLTETGHHYIHVWVECFLAWHLQQHGLTLRSDILTVEFNRPLSDAEVVAHAKRHMTTQFHTGK